MYDTQAYIFTWLLLQAYLSMTHTVCKHVKATHTYMYRRFEHVLCKLGRVKKNRKINHLSQQTELIHGNIFNNDVKHSNAQLLGYKSFVQILYTFTICYG